MEGRGTHLELEKVPRRRFERNTIVQAFCELRFPTLPEIANDAPRDFVKLIRHAFPHYEHKLDVKLGVTDRGMEQIPQATHRFFSPSKLWTAWLRTSAVGIETRAYVDFESFVAQVGTVMAAAQPCLDTDFFTRVGLRYINVLPAAIGDLEGWVRDELVGPMKPGPMSDAGHYWCEVRGTTEIGTYTFRYGCVGVEGQGQRYVLDADFAAESVEWADAPGCIRRLNELNYYLYSWAIGPRTREFLGRATDKEG